MRVNVLEGASELVIEPLNKRNNAARDAEDLAWCNGRQLLVILPLLGVLNDNNFLAVFENLQQLAKFLVGTRSKSVGKSLQIVQGTLTASIDPGACGWQCQMSGQSG